jgi:prepilin-type N-terminal cleavage/methylation domain-containing protein
MMQQGATVPQHRRAFTLIELLVAIAIIGALVALVTLGVSQMGKSSRRNSTKMYLENLKGLIVEREKGGGMQAIYALYNGGQALPTPSPLPNNTPIRVPQDLKEGAADRMPQFNTSATPIDPLNEVARTQMAMNLFRAVSMNAQLLAQMPPNAFLKNAPTVPFKAPVPVDGWGNPVIFVPPGGVLVALGSVEPTDEPVRLITSTKIYRPSQITSGADVPVGTRPFWASAGPDGILGFLDTDNNGTYDPPPAGGDIAGGDDNVYSFQP